MKGLAGGCGAVNHAVPSWYGRNQTGGKQRCKIHMRYFAAIFFWCLKEMSDRIHLKVRQHLNCVNNFYWVGRCLFGAPQSFECVATISGFLWESILFIISINLSPTFRESLTHLRVFWSSLLALPSEFPACGTRTSEACVQIIWSLMLNPNLATATSDPIIGMSFSRPSSNSESMPTSVYSFAMSLCYQILRLWQEMCQYFAF